MNEQKTIPTPQGPTYNMIKADKFDVNVSLMPNNFEFVPHKVSLSAYKTDINSLEANTLCLEAELIKRTYFIGKPTKITNIWKNQDVIDFIEDFNGMQPEFLSIKEFNNNDEAAIISTYHYPYITSVKFCELSTDKTDQYKTLKFTMRFDSMDNNYCK